MLKDLKNLLKLSLKILFIKRKRKISFHSSLPQIRPAGFSFFFRWPSSFPRPSTAASSPAHLPSPARPSHALSPAQQPRAPRRPGNCRRALLLPLVADRTAPRISSAPFLRQPPAQAAAQPRPRRASWESSRCLGLVKRQPSPPPRAPPAAPLRFRLVPAETAARRSPADLRPRRPRRRRLRAVPTSVSRPW